MTGLLVSAIVPEAEERKAMSSNSTSLEHYNKQYHFDVHEHLMTNDEYYRARASASAQYYFSDEERVTRIFEYGCGMGHGIASLPNAAGWDLSEVARRFCRDRGLQVFDCIHQAPKEAWDIVFCRHVLEHVEDPLATLRLLSPLLAERGYLYLIVPKEGHCRVPFGPDRHRHLFCWNFRSINNLLHLAGFSVESNAESYILGYRVLLPVRRVFGERAYLWAIRATGRLLRNGELVVKARRATERSDSFTA